MDTFEAVSRRVSVRKYKTDLVEKNILEKLVDAGRRAPTARKVEPWEFVVVTEKSALSQLGKIADHGPFIKDAAACIAVYCADTKYYLEDGCAATENILIAAADLGLGTCWVAGDKKDYAGDVSSLLNVPEDLRLVSLISVGWPDEDIQQFKKRSTEEVTHWEKFRDQG